MPAASRQSDCRPSAPTTRRADSDCPVAGANGDISVFRGDRVGLVVEPRQSSESSAARCFQRRHQRAVLDVVAEHIEADFVARKPHLRRADQAAGVVDQPHRLQRRRLVLAARPDLELVAGNRPSRPAARWCDCRHRARGGRSGRCSRRSCANAIAAASPAGPPPITATSYAADASFISGQLTFPAAFSSPHPALKVSSDLRGGTPQARDVQIEAIPDSTAGQMDQANQQDSSSASPRDAGRRIFRACLHGAGRGRRPDRAAGGRARALGRDVRLARAWRS